MWFGFRTVTLEILLSMTLVSTWFAASYIIILCNDHDIVQNKLYLFQSYITDKGYDVDLFFVIDEMEGHIYSDVEGHEMMNYLLLNGEIKGTDYQVEEEKK